MRFRSDVTVDVVQAVGDDLGVVRAARVSTGRDRDGDESPEAVRGLVRYLLRHRHATPFEHGQVTVRAEAPIFVFREWHRHRVWSFNETSARYRQLEPVFWVPARGRPMVPAAGYKAARPTFVEAPPELDDKVVGTLCEAYGRAWAAYSELVAAGVALEVARACLPVGTYSSMYATANPRGVLNFLALRTHDPEAAVVSYPQREIEECARQLEAAFAARWPVTHAEWVAAGRPAV